MKRVLVAGANGFIGSKLVDELVKRDYEVCLLNKTTSKFKFIEANNQFLCDLSELNHHLGRFDAVVNCASVLNGGKDWYLYSKNNCSSVQSLIENVECNSFIHISTCSIFSKESKYHSQPSPDSLYGLSKYVGEKIVEFNFRKFVSSLIIRYPIVIGKLKKSNDVISYMYREAKKNHVIELFGEGEYFRNIIHVSEAVSSIIAAIETQNLEGLFKINVGSLNSLKLIDFCKIIIDKTHSSSQIILSKKVTSNDYDSFLDVSSCSTIEYLCTTAEENLEKYFKEMTLSEI